MLGLIAFAVTYICVPLARRLALRLDAVDYPSERRVNKRPTPRMGGIAMACGIFAAIIVEVLGEYFFGWAGFYITGDNRGINHLGVMVGLLVIVLIGAMDDVYSLKPGVKLAGQALGSVIIAASGCLLSSIANPFGAGFVEFGWFAYPLTVLYLVCFMNVINLIDGLDGLADGVSTIAALTMLIIALLMGDLKMAVICAALVGACVGFIPYNRNPAKIFMGDTGATFLGYMLATVSGTGLFKLYAMISFIVPFIILGFPIYDTASAFTRRILKGQNPMKADRSHTHHKLIDMGMNQKQAVATLYMVASMLGLCAVMIVTTGYVKLILSAAALVGTAYTVTHIFRYPHDHPKTAQEPEDPEDSEEPEDSESEKKEI